MLHFQERPASGEANGLLVLHHGRGTSEADLLPLADILDPRRGLYVVAPRAPFQLPGAPGYHWYRVPRVGYPDPETFQASYRALGELHDELWDRTGLGPEQMVLGGFSMGAVMSYALGLGPDRPVSAGILAFSGFIPTVEGWNPDVAGRDDTRIFIRHGVNDPVIGVEFARRAHELLSSAELDTDYRESDAAHNIDPPDVPAAASWLAQTLGRT
jgi:phospholipase/carboxylesterase